MKKVSVKFNCPGKWAVTIEKQIEVIEGQVVNDLPLEFAAMVVDAGKGEVVEPEVAKVAKDDTPEGDPPGTIGFLFTPSQLAKLGMPALREIGGKHQITGNSLEGISTSILNAQVYTQAWLDGIDDLDLMVLAGVKGLDVDDLELDEGLTSDATEYLVAGILATQVAAEEDA